MDMSRLLKWALIVDAIATGVTGVAMAALGGVLEPLLGIPASLLIPAGIILLPYAALVGYLGTRRVVARAAIWAVIACNVAWAVDTVLLIVLGWLEPTMLGAVFVVGQAVFVLLLADVQYLGLRRSASLSLAG